MPDSRPVLPAPPGRTGPGPRPTPPAHGGAPATGGQPARPQRSRPDPNPMRLVIGMAGLASVSALLTAMLPSVTPSQVAALDAGGSTSPAPQPSVIHVTRTVTLQPGQTAPPNASVTIPPQPTPRVVVKTVTRQSGKP